MESFFAFFVTPVQTANNTAAELIPEEQRWQPVPESTGHKIKAMPTPDAQTFAEELVEEGIEEAEHDQMVKATKAGRRRDQRG